jgi:hypothetical protein
MKKKFVADIEKIKTKRVVPVIRRLLGFHDAVARGRVHLQNALQKHPPLYLQLEEGDVPEQRSFRSTNCHTPLGFLWRMSSDIHRGYLDY